MVDSNAVFASLASQDAALRETLRELPSSLTGHARPTLGKAQALADELGPTLQALRPTRPRARPDAAPAAPVPARRPRRSSATSCARSRAPRCRPSSELRPAMRDLAAATPDLTEDVQEPQLPAQRARLQPAGRHRGGLPVLALVGQPPGPDGVRHPGRPRPDPPRPRDLRLPDRRGAGRGRRRQPAARHARRPAQRPEPLAASARSSSQEPGAGGG